MARTAEKGMARPISQPGVAMTGVTRPRSNWVMVIWAPYTIQMA